MCSYFNSVFVRVMETSLKIHNDCKVIVPIEIYDYRDLDAKICEYLDI